MNQAQLDAIATAIARRSAWNEQAAEWLAQGCVSDAERAATIAVDYERFLASQVQGNV